eukprot:6186516-Pleurochrysis_carterae.AAC.1
MRACVRALASRRPLPSSCPVQYGCARPQASVTAGKEGESACGARARIGAFKAPAPRGRRQGARRFPNG